MTRSSDLDVRGAVAASIRPVWLNRFMRMPGSALNITEVSGFDNLEAVVVALLEPTGCR